MHKTLTRSICSKLDVEGHEDAVAATQRACNAAASWIAQGCGDEGSTTTNTAHHRVYGAPRERLEWGAPRAVCARAKAVEASKAVKAKHKATCPQFGPRGRVRDDARTARLLSLDRVSLHTVDGGVVCRMLLGARPHDRLLDPAWKIGGADLVGQRGRYYLHVTHSREAPDRPETAPSGGTLGVDLGIVNLATDSAGEHCTGAQVKTMRARYEQRRQRLPKVNTKNAKNAKNAKRRLRKNAGRERRFPGAVTHCLSTARGKTAAKSPNRARHAPAKT
jgi:putative transposase